MRKISLLAVMIIGLLLVGCGSKNIGPQGEPLGKDQKVINKETCIQTCQAMRKGSEKNATRDCTSMCEAGYAIENGKASGCEKSSGAMKDACYSSIAYESENIEFCKNINDKVVMFGCYTSIAEKSKNKDICDDIEDKLWKESCIAAAEKIN